MSCSNGTAPVNIVNNPEFICDLKCEYGFKYPQTGLNISNRGEYLSLKTDSSNSPPVTYNANKYEVTDMRLYQPSLHSYNGKKADAELIIVHNNVSSQGSLLVCVPILVGTSSSNVDSLSLFDTIVSEVAKTANSPGTKTTVNIPTFSIGKFIPQKPYYSYTGTLPYSPCNGEYDYVVFSKDNDASLSMSSMAYESLQQIITSNGSSINNNKNGVFFNKNGPTTLSGSVNGDLYMECLPTGSEGETLVPIAKSSEQMFNTQMIKNIFKNNIVLQILTGILIMIALTKAGQWILNKLTSEKVQSGGIRSGGIQSGGMQSGSMQSGSMQGGSIKKLITQMRKHK
jgi:carbonic anhydrase